MMHNNTHCYSCSLLLPAMLSAKRVYIHSKLYVAVGNSKINNSQLGYIYKSPVFLDLALGRLFFLISHFSFHSFFVPFRSIGIQ